MKNKVVYVIVIHKIRVTFPCGIMSDMSDENRAKLVEYILYQTGIEFSGLMTVDLNSILVPIVYADGSDDIFIITYYTFTSIVALVLLLMLNQLILNKTNFGIEKVLMPFILLII